MQQNKPTKFQGELGSIIENKAEVFGKLESVFGLFETKRLLGLFNNYKQKGHQVSTLLSMLLLLPFYGLSNVYGLVRSNLDAANKDAYYDIKNNERMDWRHLLLLFAQQFRLLVGSRAGLQKDGTTALVGDDSVVHKTGKKIEKVSKVHDHVSNTYVLGFKLLVLGFWDGGSFIPIDFSLHREKGSKLGKAAQAVKSATKSLNAVTEKVKKSSQSLEKKTLSLHKHKNRVQEKPTNTNLKNYERAVASMQKARARLSGLQNLQTAKQLDLKQKEEELQKVQKKNPAYGLSRKEKQQQYRKKREKGSNGYKRSKEADMSKVDMLIAMIKRAVKNGFVPDYILTDTWFFCARLLATAEALSEKGIKLLSMVKMGNTVYTLLPGGKQYNAQALLMLHERHAQYSRKLKAHYIKIPVTYCGIRINLFFVRIGSKSSWRLLATNDLNIGFIEVMQVYKIRWSIEVFFKEAKQYLNLGESCSSDFDGQIADATISMLQHIMLTFFKRMNHQQSFGELFKEVSHEMVQANLCDNLWEVFIVVLRDVCDKLGIDTMEIIGQALKKEGTLELVDLLLLQKSPQKMRA